MSVQLWALPHPVIKGLLYLSHRDRSQASLATLIIPLPRIVQFFATMLFSTIIMAVLVGLTSAAVLKRQSISAISESQIASFTPYTYFAAAVKCVPSLTQTWSCGSTHLTLSYLPTILTRSLSSPENCKANPTFIPYAVGGDGNAIQYCAHIH